MKGNWDGFSGSGGSSSGGGDGGGIEQGVASAAVDSHSMPQTGTPNSVTKNYKDGKLSTERYYGGDGKPYLDIDYSNHGNAKMHPHVPHEHKITFKDGKMNRAKSDGRIKQ